MNPSIENVVILGGGTAGWMTAAALSKVLNKSVNITLVESEAIGTVGVGEATIPHIQQFNQLLGLDENAFMRETQATFKLGIEFVDWFQRGHSYIHPFGSYGVSLSSIPFHHYWLRACQSGKAPDLSAFSLNIAAAQKKRFLRPEDAPNSPMASMRYAFHFDAGLYAQYLRRMAEAAGVTRIEGELEQVRQNIDTGFIDTLYLKNGKEVSGQLFIDCSGFNGVLIEKTLHTGYDDWSYLLPCDSAYAVATELPTSEHADACVPYTRATAKSAGWQWRIPLQHRIGNGHVFASRYINKQDALDVLMGGLDTPALTEPRLLNFTTGRRKKMWNKNCIALGLASGFLEPLESTSIHLVQSGILRLLGLFPDVTFAQAGIDKYNDEAELEMQRVRDFLVLHYVATKRDDSEFWRDCAALPIPDYLAEKMSQYAQVGHCSRARNDLFGEASWLAVLNGQGVQAASYNRAADDISDEELSHHMQSIASVIEQASSSLPTQQEYIARYCAATKTASL